MKEVISEYGKMIVLAVCTFAVLSLLFIARAFNGNILNLAGENALSMNRSSLDESVADSAYNSVLSSMELDDKDIAVRKNLISNEVYDKDSIVESRSGKNELGVKILSIQGISGIHEGEDVTGIILSGETLTFDRAGTYGIRMRIENKKGQYLYGVMYYSVSEKGGVAV